MGCNSQADNQGLPDDELLRILPDSKHSLQLGEKPGIKIVLSQDDEFGSLLGKEKGKVIVNYYDCCWSRHQIVL